MIFYLREFCSLNIDSIKFLMSWLNWCHKNVWIYYYYYYFSFFLILLTSNICSHISLCFNRAFTMYFFEIIKAILLSLCILVTVTTIMSDFVFFNALFTALRIFIACKIQFSFFEVTINLLSWYNIFCDFDEDFLIIRFHSFAFAFAFMFAFAFALVTWAAFCTYVSFCVDFCESCMTCNVCKICVFCKICKFSVICFVLIFFWCFQHFVESIVEWFSVCCLFNFEVNQFASELSFLCFRCMLFECRLSYNL